MRKLIFVTTSMLALSVGTTWPETVSGLVTKVDESAGKITIKHGPIRKFDMDEGMTMVFRANDPATLKAVKGRRQGELRA